MFIREIKPEEFVILSQLMVDVYSNLEGFPTPQEQPHYYEMLQNIGALTQKPNTKVLVAISDSHQLLGGVVYFSDMKQYGSGGTATTETCASGIRLLAVRPEARKHGVGKALTEYCIDLAKQSAHQQVILHTTQAMAIAWKMYEKLGFVRSEDLDFQQAELSVFGFRLTL
ncbi:GNAT family N-acetyltransferase [Celerinatantimonas sp. YJH-8]|uniref:GNAT family N-acetyltransferase n=1 Tax=Celerinatantimonas sp. YJH-8 TaxID=3228714 RepID=UPI0038C5FBD1